MASLRIGTAVSDGAGISRGYLKIGDMPDGRPMQIPVLIGRGAKAGPTLWIHGCVHGNEACGAFVVHRLFRELDPNALSGTIVALPILNITAFRAKQRMSPFEGFAGGDLNRCFPGKPDGALTEQMAHAIYTELRAHASYFIDLHTAMTADVRWALFANAPGEIGKKGEGMARAFGFTSTLPAPMDILAGSAMMTAARDGIPSLIVEAGGKGPAFTVELVTEVVERMRNVMRHLGMLSGSSDRARAAHLLLELRLGPRRAGWPVPARGPMRRDAEGRHRARPLLRSLGPADRGGAESPRWRGARDPPRPAHDERRDARAHRARSAGGVARR